MKAAFFAVFLLACLWGLSAGETHREDDDTIKLGLYFVYDKDFAEQAIFKENDTFNAYFTALTGAAEAYFRNHHHLTILLTLVNSSKMEDDEKLKYVTEGEEKYLDASDTLRELEGIFTWNGNLSKDVDVVFLVTGYNSYMSALVSPSHTTNYYKILCRLFPRPLGTFMLSPTVNTTDVALCRRKMKTRVSDMTGEWYGLAAPRSICYGDASVGIIHDDGITFNGANLLAIQVALLLGASKDNGRWRECPLSDDYLMSSINGGRHPVLSGCSERSMWTFHGRVQDKDRCWKDSPQGALEKKDLPVNFYGERKCDVCELRNATKSENFQCLGKKLYRPHGDCKVYCCSSRATRVSRRQCEERNPVNLPDGTPCAGWKTCIRGECV